MADEIFKMVWGAMGSVGLLILKHAVSELKEMKANQAEHNRLIAVMVERVDSHERRLTKLEGE